ncbi:ABC transporter permease [Enterococcus rivorum]|uniref:Putative hemin transport system permease protein HrtB n=2 Tax=Enterococcus rivorum TaxID=762845 RepID=A0A1E5L1U1_9ENTE|nr:ABC transporter permease [Enterococcus rivorum]MBP2097733.1 putative ABC transport system permease protein [Enterococcus rivorum]OEH84001.1 permease [Enterococcus rivorum]
MFLGINEIKYSKGRYVLVISVMVLIAWLIFILSGLANGLAQGNRIAVDQWKADKIVLADDANSNLNASVVEEKVKETITGGTAEPIGQLSLAIGEAKDKNKSTDLTNVSLFGIDEAGFLMPKVIEGKAFTDKNQVIGSIALKNQGFKIGDKITAGKYDEELEIVGWTEKSSFNIVPVLYTSIDTWRSIKYGENPAMQNVVNGYVVRAKDNKTVKTSDGNSKVIAIPDFIEKLPGYSAQNLTLDGMIYFLIVIAAFIIGIFIFVMTLQKTAMFGVLKVQGVPTSYLAKSVLLQTLVLALIGVGIGLALTAITVAFLPESMPYATNYNRMGIFSILLIVSAIVGGAFSIRTIAKIDPLIAIGG